MLFDQQLWMSDYLPALTGGLMIGLSATIMILFMGRIAGISGILFGALSKPNSSGWAISFLIGLIVGALLLHNLSGQPIPTSDIPYHYLIPSALLVGFGTRLGSGCTSGHGICGLARLSTRSIVATCVFMGAAMLMVFVTRHLL